MKKGRQSQENIGVVQFVKPVMTSSLAGSVISAVIMLILSFALTIKDLPHAAIEPMALAAGIIGTICAGFICSKVVRRNGLALGALCGLMAFLIMGLASFITAQSYPGVESLLKSIVFIFGGAIGGVLGVNSHSRIK